MDNYNINIVSLSSEPTYFEFELGKDFLDIYGTLLFQTCDFKVKITLNKQESLIESIIHIEGFTRLICDRSLEEFDYPITVDKRIVFNYGDEAGEIAEDLVMIKYDQHKIEFGQILYELIGIHIPIKKLHPKYEKEDAKEASDTLVYTTIASNQESKKKSVDPRWEKLKNFN